MPKPTPMPFYLAANAPERWANESSILEDAEYLKSIAPAEILRYRKEVSQILDDMDFDDHSMYDEYPDKNKLENLSGQVLRQIQHNEERVNPRSPLQPQKWQWLNYLIYQLLLEEIFYRRHRHRPPIRPGRPRTPTHPGRPNPPFFSAPTAQPRLGSPNRRSQRNSAPYPMPPRIGQGRN